ncbi:MAG TPA: bifunctional (p)ppGpp synthetase/guanosine-3',5'-bis(diphosphate) 3'-pyrophosphohydrolase [Terriglobia bacterium]|jgi:guanosine-3',5'-bis(diphosphate) 3'-pyrophosphohydrolase|nr:bifunctional (p)ppGpp synthetase/guanosine-3',5'-bis(diphosphate) 3'-pyrophosphohydrolase [Terriglobia bacterium]
MLSFEEIAGKVQAYRPGDDLALLRKAYEFSASEHRTQKRLSGEPYVSHPLEVANVLADMKLDVVCLAGGMLHDVVEDTPTTIDRLRQEFGADVAHIVEGVTKISRLQFETQEEKQAENLRKMFLAMVDDIRVVLVKLADRLHNMRTLGALPPEKRVRVSQETLEIYAPIAHRLGMGKMRGELEDLAFRYLEPEAYEEVRNAVESRRKVSEEFLAEVRAQVESTMKKNGIPAHVEGRIKRLYSIWRKMQRQEIPIEKVYDLLAVRIVTDSVKNCYAALGMIHQTWPPVPDRIKDFIAMARPNLYQSLHTSVIGPNGQPFEVQIRTEEMHRVAEEGIAAHWKYKDGKPAAKEDEQRMAWLRRLVDLQQEMRDPSDFLSTLKIDLYPQEVYTFTPKGKVVVLPREATPIDFAYAVHSEVGQHCSSARVNGRMVPLKSKLANGDVVEITTSPGQRPSRDWLSVVKTSKARNKIKHWINQAERTQAIEIGRKLLEKEARRYSVSLKEVTEEDYLRVASDYGCTQLDDVLAGVGYGKFGARQVLGKLSPSIPDEAQPEPSSLAATVKRALGLERDLAIQVHGHDDLMVYRAKCCNPVRGEEIVGYVTRGKGIAVHSKSCHNVQNLLYDADRRITVEWSGPKYTLYTVKLALTTADRRGLLAEVTSAISDVHSNIQNIQAHTGDERATIDVTLDTVDIQHLRKIVSSLRKIDGVYEVKRIMS